MKRRDLELAIEKARQDLCNSGFANSQLREKLREAERSLAQYDGNEYAVPIEMPLWITSVPMPHLLQNEQEAVLIYHVHVPLSQGEDHEDTNKVLAVITFQRCICTKMGTPNDEVFSGHPLYGRGFIEYSPMAVMNSRWIKELETINSVHSRYRPERWRAFQHYLLPFHDCTIECVAEGYKAETRSIASGGIPSIDSFLRYAGI